MRLAAVLIALAVPLGLDCSSAAEQGGGVIAPARAQAAIVTARSHPSYQVFAARKLLPSITSAGEQSIRVGDSITVEFRFPEGLGTEDKEKLAKDLAVPEALLDNLHRRLSETKPENGDFSASFRTSIIDFHYLRDRWDKYSPNESGALRGKKEAIELLRKGELEKPWLMYLALPKPAPPAGGVSGAQAPE